MHHTFLCLMGKNTVYYWWSYSKNQSYLSWPLSIHDHYPSVTIIHPWPFSCVWCWNMKLYKCKLNAIMETNKFHFDKTMITSTMRLNVYKYRIKYSFKKTLFYKHLIFILRITPNLMPPIHVLPKINWSVLRIWKIIRFDL